MPTPRDSSQSLLFRRPSYEISKRSRLLEEFGGVWSQQASIVDDEPEDIWHAWVTANLFSLLGEDPILGRHFLPEEEAENGPNVMILGYGIWQRRYGGDPGIIGKPIQLNDTVRTVIGVMPEGFWILLRDDTGVPPRVDVFIPQNFWQQRNVRWLRVIGQLAPGVTLAQGQSDLDNITESLVSEYQEYATTGFSRYAIPLHGDLVRDVRPAVLALLGAVGFVLLIACSNVANLSLARTKLREQEIALRLALGAGQGRILRQILTENDRRWFDDPHLHTSRGSRPRLPFREPIDVPRAAVLRRVLDARESLGFLSSAHGQSGGAPRSESGGGGITLAALGPPLHQQLRI